MGSGKGLPWIMEKSELNCKNAVDVFGNQF